MEAVIQSLKIPLKGYVLGFGQDFKDVYSDWKSASEVEEDGCVLVRPDRVVAWRSQKLTNNPSQTLEEVLKAVLAL